jgi:serine O-acetyltransferase
MSNQVSKSKQLYQSNFLEQRIYLNKHKVEQWIEALFSWLFCTQEEYINYAYFEEKETTLIQDLAIFLKQERYTKENAQTIAKDFFENITIVHEKLLQDLNIVMEFDPAAKSRNEVLLAYPGFFVITVYRIANALLNYKIPVLPRLLSEYAHSKTGIDIHPAAQIGESFLIDHGTGIVIGETAIIGNNVKIYQGVTLGALSVSKEKAEEKRHPTIEDKVIIYANATILGGKTTIGKGAVIGGNVWITESIPAQSLVFHKSEIIVKTKQQFPEALNFSI